MPTLPTPPAAFADTEVGALFGIDAGIGAGTTTIRNLSAAEAAALAGAEPHPDHAASEQAGAQMERLMTDLRQLYHERNDALREVTRAHHEALLRLAMAAEYRNGDTGVHIVRMGLLAEALALALGEPPAWAAMLRKAAPMHDVGKIGLPDHVLNKPGALTPAERMVMNSHPRMGAEILGRSRVALFELAAEVALTHHERWDGAGYPQGLAGEAIPLSGRIVAVVDCFDALTMDRCYRPAFATGQALEMLRAERGRAFCPRVLDAFLAEAPAMARLRDDVNSRGLGFMDLTDEGEALRRPLRERAPLTEAA